MMSSRRAAIYGRVSTDWQTTDNQTAALKEVAERRGWEVVEVYIDHRISGTKGRNKRPGFDQMLKDANHRKFDVVMAWSIGLMGRSLRNLLETIEHLKAIAVDIYLEQQNIDTTTPAGKLLFPGNRRLRRVRALNDPATGHGAGASQSARQAA